MLICFTLLYESRATTFCISCFWSSLSLWLADHAMLWPVAMACLRVCFEKCCVVLPVNCLRYPKHAHLLFDVTLHVCWLAVSSLLVVVCPCSIVCVHTSFKFPTSTCHRQDMDIMWKYGNLIIITQTHYTHAHTHLHMHSHVHTHTCA